MKFISILLSVLLFLAVAVTAQDEEQQQQQHVEQQQQHAEEQQQHVDVDPSGEVHEPVPVECNCNDEIVAALQPLENIKNGLTQQVNKLREELNACANDKAGLYQEVEQTRKSLEQARADAARWMKAAGEHEGSAKEKHGMVEEKIRHLGEMESKMKSLEADLLAAKEEIKNLSEISFVSQLKKELETLWQSILLFWQNLMAKKED
jgi:uncharacterized coiled-coil DUF342 family protein